MVMSGNTDSPTIGGLVGYKSYYGSTVNNSYWDKESFGLDTSQGGEPLDSVSMKTQFAFSSAGWDFTNVWNIVVSSGPDSGKVVTSGYYPTLRSAPPPVVSVFRGSTARGKISNALAPKITVRGRVMSVSAPANSNYQIRVINMRGRVVARINANSGGRYPLGKISAGRYLIETRVNGRVINVLPHNI
jgi:hypothetical protein